MRTTGFSLACSLATALFGGLTPLVSTLLIEGTGDKAAPGCWIAGAGAISLLAKWLIYRGIVRERHPAAAYAPHPATRIPHLLGSGKRIVL